jgi:DNA repair protein RadC
MSSRDVESFITTALPNLRFQTEESFIAIGLDAKHRVAAWAELGRGSMTACPVDVPGAFRWALLSGVACLVFVHNHPSGQPDPSPEDIALTRALVKAGALLQIEVLDHVVIGDPGYFSFMDSGLLANAKEGA